jgi:hypothetical protein
VNEVPTLTREQVLTLPVGRDLDVLVAEHIMGWKPWRSPVARLLDEPDCWETDDPECPSVRRSGWCPSADIAAAWDVVRKMRSGGRTFLLGDRVGGGVVASFSRGTVDRNFKADGSTDEEAICRAALLAVTEGRR